MTPDRLQDGIYFRSGQRPPPYFRLLLLDFPPSTQPTEAGSAIGRTLTMLGDLRQGNVRDLVGQDDEQTARAADEFRGTDFMVAFGARLFDNKQHNPPLVGSPRPDFLVRLAGDDEAFPALPWGVLSDRRGESDVALRLTGFSEASVNRSAVEIWKLQQDEKLAFKIVASFEGFSRRDGRGWLDFHDGVSNIESSERLVAIQAGPDPAWMGGGTYMCFLRFAVDLSAWRALDRAEQELIVGREKLTGRPLIGINRGPAGEVLPVAEAGAAAGQGVAPGADFREPPEVSDPLVKASHLQRANRNRASPSAPAAYRIYRQGYEFLETLDDHGPRLGLNFVSFQGDLGRLRRVLHLPTWLGDINFGGLPAGSAEHPPLQLISLVAGGLYCIPPSESPFPGAQLFNRSADESRAAR
jgi:deferrochelatase/peroxidase EfeB